MSRALKLALIAALLSVVLVACGDGDQTSPTAAAGGDVTSTTAPEPAKPAPEGRGTVGENADGTRTVTSAYGTATVRRSPSASSRCSATSTSRPCWPSA